MAPKTRTTEIVRIFNPHSRDRRTRLPKRIAERFHAGYGQTLYFQRENGEIIVKKSAPQDGNLLFSIGVGKEKRPRLSEANLRAIGAKFGGRLEFRFIEEDIAIINVLKQQSENKRQTVTARPLESEMEQAAIERSIKVGAGFGSPETNRKVERAAVSYVTRWYESRGWKVESVESEKRGYDLLCVKDADEEHVEVKGRQGESPSFIITAGEAEQAKNNSRFIICVVTSALKREPELFRYRGKELIESFNLSPIAFRATLKRKNG